MSHTSIIIHYVLSTYKRKPLLARADRIELLNYIAGLIRNKGAILYIGSILREHIHLLVQIPATISVADLARDIKANSSLFIKGKESVMGEFSWGEGYGAFSVSHSQMTKVANYISNQSEHHRSSDFDGEYKALLELHEINDG